MDMKRKMFIKIYYSLLDWEWYSDTNTFRVFMHLLLTANRKDQPYKGDVIRRGESFASLEFISDATGLSIQSVRSGIANLLKTKEITKRKIGYVNAYYLVNYDKWQNAQEAFDDNSTTVQQQPRKSVTTVQQQPDNSLTALRYCNNEENERMKECERNTHARGKLNNVFITDEEYAQFKSQYNFADEIIDELSAKIATGDPKYRYGHIGHLYVFAKNFSKQKAPESVSYDIELAMKRALALDPAKTKRI